MGRSKMKKELQNMLREAMEAPVPGRKQEFIQSMKKRQSCRRMGYGRFVAEQVFYIGRWGWCTSFGIFLISLFLGSYTDKNVLWVLSAVAPFLAVTFLAEGLRSEICGMAELELATRFSLKSLIFARMAVMGTLHLLLLVFAAFLGYRKGNLPFWHTGVYLLVPYLLTNMAGLYLAKKIRGRECIYGILAAATVISVLPFAIKLLYREELFIWWLAALAVFSVLAVKEWKENVERWEEYTWNLS